MQLRLGMDGGRDVGGRHEFELDRVAFGSIPKHLTQFRNLQKLTLLELYGDIPTWSKCITEMLVHNTALEHISLSISDEALEQATIDEPAVTSRPSFLLFEDICKGYKKVSNTILALKTLRLGAGIHFPVPAVLAGAVDATTLQDIFIYNRLVCHRQSLSFFSFLNPKDFELFLVCILIALTFSQEIHAEGPWDMSWDVLSGTTTPALERLAFHELTEEVVEELKKFQRRVNFQADGTCPFIESDDDPYRIPGSMYRIFGEDSLGTSQVLLPRDNFHSHFICEEVLPLKNSSHITQLGISRHIHLPSRDDLKERCEASGPSCIQILCGLLETLPRLEAFWIRHEPNTNIHTKVSPQSVTRLEPCVSELAKACPTLRHVRIGRLAWQIWPDAVGQPSLALLDEWEAQTSGPSLFHAPKPLPWSCSTNHIEL